MRRSCIVVAVLACLFAFACASAAPAAPAANAECLGCHGTGGQASTVDFSAPGVDTAKCAKCHWVDRHWFDIFHQQAVYPGYMGQQCNTCHGSDLPARPAIVGYPAYSAPAGNFLSAASLDATPGALHAIHVNGSWAKGAKGDIAGCVSCHGPASCDSCHDAPASAHADHTKSAAKTVSVSMNVGKKYGDTTPDTYLYSKAPTSLYGTGSTIYVGNNGSGEQRSVIRFPLSKAAGTSVTSATMQLTRVSAGTNFPIRAYRLRRADWAEPQANWNTYKTGSSWSAPGAGSSAGDYFPDPYVESAAGTGVFDVTPLVKAAAAAGESYVDLLLVDPAPVSRRYVAFYSQQTSMTDWQPALLIEATTTASVYANPPLTYTVCAGAPAGFEESGLTFSQTSTCVNAECHGLAAAGAGFVPACASCHPDRVATHGYDPVVHTGAPGSADISIDGVSYGTQQCSSCHATELKTEHAKATSSSASRGCAACHPAARATFATWDKGCVQGGCHAPAGPAPMHAGIDAAHATSPANAGCFESGCHLGADKDLAALHADASTTTAGVTRTSCAVCHAGGVPASKDCTSCHPDRVTPHGYDPARHTSTETCLLTCHQAEIKPEHEAHQPALACSDCHAAKVAQIAPWDKSCRACHAVIAHASANHTGTDVAVRASRAGYGCSDTAPDQTGCHDIGNVSALHAKLPQGGCPLCHGAGKTPSTECRTCHPAGDAKVSKVATFYPDADGALTAPVTVFPAAPATRWDKVAEAASDGDSTYLTFTGTGRATFTSAPQTIPTTATISSVTVYYRAKRIAASPTTARIGVTVNVGGTYYDRAVAQPQTTYPTGLGTGASMSTNPKTGLAWKPQDLNSPAGADSLREFGVYTTNAAPNVRVTQCFVVVNYSLEMDTLPLGGTMYHHNNVKYLMDPSDAEPGLDYYYGSGNPPHGWNDALYFQDCYDFCHSNNAPLPEFRAYEGTRMWYSVGGQFAPETRTLTLASIKLPSEAPRLDFMTTWRLTDLDWGGNDTGYVEISTNDGASYVPLTGTVGGVSRASLTGNIASWVPASYDLSAYAGKDVRLRFRYVNGGSGAAGWAFDSLTVSGSSGTVFSDNAETAKSEWTSYHWTRSSKAFGFF